MFMLVVRALAACNLALCALGLSAASRLAIAQATKDTVSAPVRDLHYDVTFTRSDAQSRPSKFR